jgi:hypothetical protein
MAATRRPPAGVAALDAALSQALFTRFGGKQGPARRCAARTREPQSCLLLACALLRARR